MSAVRREYLDQLNTDAEVIPLKPRSDFPAALRGILSGSTANTNTDIEDALNIVKKAANTIDLLVAREKEFESNAAAMVEQYKSEAVIARSKLLNLCLQFKKFTAEAESEMVIAKGRICDLEAQIKSLRRELETSNNHHQSWLHFRSQVTALLADAPAKLEESRIAPVAPLPIDNYSASYSMNWKGLAVQL
jgi:hypothetical protein